MSILCCPFKKTLLFSRVLTVILYVVAFPGVLGTCYNISSEIVWAGIVLKLLFWCGDNTNQHISCQCHPTNLSNKDSICPSTWTRVLSTQRHFLIKSHSPKVVSSRFYDCILDAQRTTAEGCCRCELKLPGSAGGGWRWWCTAAFWWASPCTSAPAPGPCPLWSAGLWPPGPRALHRTASACCPSWGQRDGSQRQSLSQTQTRIQRAHPSALTAANRHHFS